ncbi:MAG: RagB/SusD family nutrient uptake outer membrane protein [Prolixibacteraceae bacterium]|nr:RagB/SusD family nutrient uptake outer membrane protein [Prolixibacteraceae bacterium]
MKKIVIFSLVVLTAFMFSCSEEWLDTKPKAANSINTFYSETGVNALLTGAYSMLDGHYNNDWAFNQWGGSITNWVWGSVAADDAYKGSDPSDQQTINDIEQFNVSPSNEYCDSKWRFMYEGVSRCNEILKVTSAVTDDQVSADKKAWFEAQTKVLRAHYYFELTRVFGKVPYIDENTEAPETVKNDKLLFAEIEADLKAAIPSLKSRETEKARITSWAAKAYLAKVYLFQKKYAEAKPLLQDIIDNGGYSLMPNYQDNYMVATQNNAESILEVQYAVNDGTDGSLNGGWGDALNFPSAGPSTCCGFFQASRNFANAFKVVEATGLPDFTNWNAPGQEVGGVEYTGAVDPRLDHSIGRPGIPFLDWGVQPTNNSWVRDPSNGGPFLFKKSLYKASEKSKATQTGWATGVNANNFRFIRLAHIYLWAAECEAEAGGSLDKAKDYVNLIRNRAKASAVVTMADGTPAANYKVEPYASFANADDAKRAIRLEHRLEFGMEGGRFFDLVRWGIVAQTMQNYLTTEAPRRSYLAGKSFKATNEIWPIPQTQIDLSKVNGVSSLTQNPGY